MNKAFLNIIFYISAWLNTQAQTNLVYNGSFEERSNCPNLTSQPGANQLFALGWCAPTFATTDYFNSCDFSLHVGVPQNNFGYQESHNGGNAYTAIAYGSGRGKTNNNVYYNYSEYLQSRLIKPLESGMLYNIRFYLSRADSMNGSIIPRFADIAIDRIGVLLSSDSIGGPDSLFYGLLPYIPSCESEPGVLLTDTTEWQEVNLVYIANGGEQYLTIGFFNDINNISASYYYHDFDTTDVITAYYYLDDVSVIQGDEIDIPNIFTPNGDGVNDEFVFTISDKVKIDIKIYNRWGVEVFRQQGNQILWDGRGPLNKNCSEGTYFYVAEISSGSNSSYKKGFVQLVR